MNTLAHIAALVTLLGLSMFFFNTVGEVLGTAVGFSCLVLTVLYLVLLFQAAMNDWSDYSGKKGR